MDRLLPKTITNNSPKAQKSGGQSLICCQRVEDNAFHSAKTAGVHRIVYKNYHRALATRFPFALYYSVSEQTAFVRAIATAHEIRQVGAINLGRVPTSAHALFLVANQSFAISSQRLLTGNIRWDDLQLRSERSRSQMGNY